MNRFELADAMIRGKNTEGVVEDRSYYIGVSSLFEDTPCMACALGCALIGFYDGDFKKAEKIAGARWSQKDDLKVLADLLDIPVSLAIEIEYKHLNGMPIQQIAAWLKSSECPDVEVSFNV